MRPLAASASAADVAAATGVFFEQPTPEALIEAVERFEKHEPAFRPEAIRGHAERFGAPRFRRELEREIERCLSSQAPARRSPATPMSAE